MPKYTNLKSTEYSDGLLEIISNQLQVSNLQGEMLQGKHFEKQIEALRMKIISQRVELGIAIGGV